MAGSSPAAADRAGTPWTAPRLFGVLREFSPLRVISICGPSTFEAICEFGPHGFAGGHMNAITPHYHWHLRLDGMGWVATHDQLHARSGRRVLFLELREHASAPPFLLLYLHRERDADFDPAPERRFAEAHAELAAGRPISAEGAP